MAKRKANAYKLPPSVCTNQRFAELRSQLEHYGPVAGAILSGKAAAEPKEQMVRRVVEMLFRQPFPKRRPPWLASPDSNRALELDGYCESLHIAVEYQSGLHHYYDGDTRYKDRLKHNLCAAHGVRLVEIWPDQNTSRLPLQILEEMARLRMINRVPPLWLGCWINLISQRVIVAHGLLNRRRPITG